MNAHVTNDPLQPFVDRVARPILDELEQLRAEVQALRERPALPLPLMTRREIAATLNIDVAGIDRLRARGLPEVRVGGLPRFEWAAVQRWLREFGGEGAVNG